jgi:hypothetical protein
VFEDRTLRKFFLLKREEVTGDWRRLHNEYYFGANGPYEGEGLCLQVFSSESEGRNKLGRCQLRYGNNIKFLLE